MVWNGKTICGTIGNTEKKEEGMVFGGHTYLVQSVTDDVVQHWRQHAHQALKMMTKMEFCPISDEIQERGRCKSGEWKKKDAQSTLHLDAFPLLYVSQQEIEWYALT